MLVTLTVIALIDAMSILPLSVVVLSVLFGGKRPYLSAGAFLAGVFLSYLMLGLAVMFGLNVVFEQLNSWAARWWTAPDPEELALQILIGAVLIWMAVRLARHPERSNEKRVEEAISPANAFLTAVGLNIVGLPGALPYFGAIDQILRADLPISNMVLVLVYYNVVFTFPQAAIAVALAVMGQRIQPFLNGLVSFFETWGRWIIITAVGLLGLVMVADGVGWFMGYPLIPV